MTIGQRIAQNRKNLGLSQEALGEKLGVSRQSIYKWESDAALPEIEKLIALSRLFSISVGALLGVEEDAAPAPEESGELSEAQLNMIEEITRRYIEALPKQAPKKKHPILKALAILAIVLAAWKFYGKVEQMDQQYRLLTSQISDVRMTVESQIDGISTRVENILEAQNALVADRETAIAATDMKNGLVTFSFRVVPKTFTADTIAYIEVANQGDIETFGPFAPAENQTFTGEVTTALTDEIVLSVVFEDGGVRQTQLLEEYTNLYRSSLPDVWSFHTDFWRLDLKEPYVFEFPSKHGDGQVVHLSSTSLENGKQLASNEPAAQIDTVKIGLFVNQTLVAWADPIAQPGNYIGFEGHLFFKFPEVRVELTDQDSICAAALVTDSYGRTFIRQDSPFHTAEEGTLLDHFDNYRLDDTLENWTF